MSITTILCEFKKRKSGFDSKFFKIEKKIVISAYNSNPLGLKKLLQLREILTYLGSKTIKERGTWIDLGLTRLFKLCRFDLGRVDCITKMISVHERLIILLLLGTLFIFGHGWLHSNHFCKRCQNCFCPSWRFAPHDGICRSFHNKATIHTSALRCVLHLKIWTKTVLTWFTKIIAEQPSLTQYTIWKKNRYAIIHWYQFHDISFPFWEI